VISEGGQVPSVKCPLTLSRGQNFIEQQLHSKKSIISCSRFLPDWQRAVEGSIAREAPLYSHTLYQAPEFGWLVTSFEMAYSVHPFSLAFAFSRWLWVPVGLTSL